MFSLQEVHSFYGDSHILHGISLDLPQGQAVGLLGRNGMGKTTLIRTLMGYVAARSGRVFADGKEVTNSAPKEWRVLALAMSPKGAAYSPISPSRKTS
jgi:branched-chain amino acid transport system ATP-binding protein